jgi:seryl-tRNA synthetase
VIDLRALRETPEAFRASQAARGERRDLVDAVLAADERRRNALGEFESLRAEQKAIGRRVAQTSGQDREDALRRARELADAVKDAERQASDAEQQTRALALDLANLIDPDAPVGAEQDFVVLDTVGSPRDFAAEGFEPRDHVELGRLLAAIDIERAAKVSGSRFYYLVGVGALLELALVNLAMAQAEQTGFVPVLPPVLVRPEAMEGTGFLGQAAENVFHLEHDDFYLVGTSEVPLAALHGGEILDAARLPLRYAGFSTCFRREAGSHGKDTRGIIRVHQFDKVEMFSFCAPEDAADEHGRLLAWERQFFDLLEVPYRVIDVASQDLGASAARKYDIEAWIPTQGTYREVTSTSNCTQYQARRLQVRMRDHDGAPTRPAATLNGTLVAIPRAIVALLENHQQPDGSVRVPAALRPYLGGRDTLDPVLAGGGE